VSIDDRLGRAVRSHRLTARTRDSRQLDLLVPLFDVRFVLRRDVGSIAIADVLLLVLIADAAQNAMAGGYQTITEGMLLVATIAGWNDLLDWLAFRVRWIRRWIAPPPLPP